MSNQSKPTMVFFFFYQAFSFPCLSLTQVIVTDSFARTSSEEIPQFILSWVKKTATNSSILAWEIPWTEEPGRLQSTGLQKSRTRLSDWTTILLWVVFVISTVFLNFPLRYCHTAHCCWPEVSINQAWYPRYPLMPCFLWLIESTQMWLLSTSWALLFHWVP